MKECIWCFKKEKETTFETKAHTIPKSLGGQNYNKNVCDECNKYFGSSSNQYKYSVEEAFKEVLCISRFVLLSGSKSKRKVGEFKSKFFDLKEKNGKLNLKLRTQLNFRKGFQDALCRNFKRGLYKVWYEEYCRQYDIKPQTDDKFSYIRKFCRNDEGDLPVIYFKRSIGIVMQMKNEAATPVLKFERMNYLHNVENFVEIEFLSHVFSLLISDTHEKDFKDYMRESISKKTKFFSEAIIIRNIFDIDITMEIFIKKSHQLAGFFFILNYKLHII